VNLYFLDTSIIMYAVGKEHHYKESCVAIIEKIARQKLEVVTDSEVFQEILYRYSHIGQKEKGISVARDMLILIGNVIPVKREDVKLALEIFADSKGIKSRDAIHAAIMLNNGFNEILSTDRHFEKIKGIKRKDPFQFEPRMNTNSHK